MLAKFERTAENFSKVPCIFALKFGIFMTKNAADLIFVVSEKAVS